MTKQVLILKLTDGTEIIADTTQTENAYICTDILTIITDISETGEPQMGLMSFMPYSDNSGFAIPHNMACITMPAKNLLDHYNKQFNKIILPSTKLHLV